MPMVTVAKQMMNYRFTTILDSCNADITEGPGPGPQPRGFTDYPRLASAAGVWNG